MVKDRLLIIICILARLEFLLFAVRGVCFALPRWQSWKLNKACLIFDLGGDVIFYILGAFHPDLQGLYLALDQLFHDFSFVSLLIRLKFQGLPVTALLQVLTPKLQHYLSYAASHARVLLKHFLKVSSWRNLNGKKIYIWLENGPGSLPFTRRYF